MKRWMMLVLLSCLTAACDEDPARKIQIVARPPSPVDIAKSSPEPTIAPPEKSKPEWHPAGCPPPPESSPGPSTLKVSGPCTFEHRATFACESIHDDFIVSATHEAAGGASLMVYINVEHYNGPGTYEGAEMFVGLQDATTIHRWSSDQVSITVGPEEEYAVLPATPLEAEPLLVDCSGPQANYQCSGRNDTAPINGTVQMVAGKMQCSSAEKSK